jgi:hypothetical protein
MTKKRQKNDRKTTEKRQKWQNTEGYNFVKKIKTITFKQTNR